MNAHGCPLREFVKSVISASKWPRLLFALALVAPFSIQSQSIVLNGTAILGVNDAIDSDAGVPHVNAGVAANINDGDIGTRADTWFGADPAGAGLGVSYVGVIWPALRYDQIETVTVYLALFTDGGWFGPNGVGPGPDGILTSDFLTEPEVQITTDGGVTWTTTPHTSDYMSVMTGAPIGGPNNGNPLQSVVTFTLGTPASQIDGIRIIGQNGGAGVDPNGFLGVFEIDAASSLTADSDSDGLPDSWETANGLNVGADDSADDPDNDTLNNLQEYNSGSNPKQADTDADGLTDGDEINSYGTNPTLADTDSDGLSDGEEVNTYFSSPLLADTDADGLDDHAEAVDYHTDPNLPDSDNDGYLDALEVAQGSDPNDPSSLPNNLGLQGHGYLGLKLDLNSGPETEIERYHVGTPESINDGSTATGVDTWNGDDTGSLADTVSFVGIRWDAPITTAAASLKLTLRTFVDGGWFGVNNVGPSGGAALTPDQLVEPRIEVTVDGVTWVEVPHSSDYLTALTGHRIGGGPDGNPTLVSATFTLNQPTNGITGIRIIGTEGGAASGGFLGVAELSVMSSSTDVDGDGMDDSWERQNGLVVGTNDAAGDPDADGLTNLEEFNAKTNPKLADSDGDGLNDGPEKTQYQTDPSRADTDADGLSDGLEVNTYHSDPLVVDTDGDGFKDGLEVTLGTDPAKASSLPDNIALLGTAIIGTRDSADSGVETPHAHAGSPAAINDADLTTHVDTLNDPATSTASYVGILWSNPITNPVTRVDLTLATFFDGGWFGVNMVGPGASAPLTQADHLIEPTLQVTTDGGTNWQDVDFTSDYLTALDGHLLPVAFGAPTSATASFTLNEPQTGINGIRLIGSEGGTASGGFLGVFELAVKSATNAPPSGLTLVNAAVTGTQFTFEFDSKTGVSHVVEYKNSLTDPAWQTLTTITGDGTRKTVTDPIAGGTHRFYRVNN
jgi:hypothetical protein